MTAASRYLWWNGKLVPWDDATVHLTMIGWSCVGAVFEGIRGYWNAERGECYIFRLDDHIDRLMRSMKLMRMEPDFDRDALIDACRTLAKANAHREDIYLMPLCYTPGARPGAFTGGKAEIYITTPPTPSHLLTDFTQTVAVSSYRRISEDVMPPRVKNISNYRNSQLASMEAMLNGYDNAIILNPAGHVTEGPGACVFLVRDGVVSTPDLSSGILESITRDAFITMLRETLRMPVQERTVDRTELYVADEIFFAGTGAEVSPVTMVDHYRIGNGGIGAVTMQLMQLYNDVLRGITDHYAEWRTPVGLQTLSAVAAD